MGGINLLLSICIPTYNRAKYLRRAIASCIYECKKYGVRIYIQNNASTDCTEDVVREFDEDIIEYECNDHNVGAVKNVNKLIDKANSKYVFMLTDDDYLLPGAIKLILDFIQSNEIDFFSSDMGVYLEKSKKMYISSSCNKTGILTNEESVDVYISSFVLTRCCFKKKSLTNWRMDLRNSNVYPHKVAIMDMIIHGKKIGYIAEPLVMHTWENEIYWDVDFNRNKGVKYEELIEDCRLAEIEILNAARESLGEDLYRQYCWQMFLTGDMLISELPDSIKYEARKVWGKKKIKDYVFSNMLKLKKIVFGF